MKFGTYSDLNILSDTNVSGGTGRNPIERRTNGLKDKGS